MLLTSSQELLYLVLAICLVWFTVFLCWLLYQAGKVLQNANRIIESLAHKLELINEAVQYMRSKVDGVSKNMGVVSSMISGLAEKFVMGKLASRFEQKVSSAMKPMTEKKGVKKRVKAK